MPPARVLDALDSVTQFLDPGLKSVNVLREREIARAPELHRLSLKPSLASNDERFLVRWLTTEVISAS